MQPTPVLSPGESHGQRSLAVHGVTESDTTEQLTHMAYINDRIMRLPRLFIFADLHFLVLLH